VDFFTCIEELKKKGGGGDDERAVCSSARRATKHTKIYALARLAP